MGSLIERKKRILMATDPELPPWYKRVEYIKSTGTQYIVINSNFNTGVQFTLVCQSDNVSTTQVILGQSARGGYWFGSTNGKYAITNREFSNVLLTDKVTVKILYVSDYGIYANVNGIEQHSSFISGGNRELTIFGAQGGSAWFYSSTKIFGLKAAGICNLIPCYRIADGVIGMYNAVTKEFLTNSGTGTFIKGPDIQ